MICLVLYRVLLLLIVNLQFGIIKAITILIHSHGFVGD